MNVGRLLGETGLDSDELRVAIYPILPEDLSLKPASSLMMRIWGLDIQAVTIRNWIFVDPKILTGDRTKLARLTIHELIHVRQFNDLGMVKFFRRYAAEYIQGRRSGLTHREAYRRIGYEVEARDLQWTLGDH